MRHAGSSQALVTTPAYSPFPLTRRHAMKWSKPQYQDLRFGFEITMYISNR
ncbi:pyrroloquinoline quinone precursor peptide PqqA [Piscinibacter sp.]|uniref:pyrroloquinoline quinone precursor peptide PqqA n=1 Tax=Piscinibacter sp. TaxID=1903157 RepID=UPI002F42ABCA